MREITIAVAALLLTWLALSGLAFALVRWRLAKANRVSPTCKSPAGLMWLWSPGRPARLHRRLRAAVTLVASDRPFPSTDAPTLSVDSLRRELETQAIELDHHLVICARYPLRQRTDVLRRLDAQVAEVERLALRLSAMRRPIGAPASGWAPPAPAEVLGHISDQLDLLDAAQQELATIERSSGLGVLTPHPERSMAPPPSFPSAPGSSGRAGG